MAPSAPIATQPMEPIDAQAKRSRNDLSRSLTPFDPNRTLIPVIELSKESWLVAGIVPGVERQDPMRTSGLRHSIDELCTGADPRLYLKAFVKNFARSSRVCWRASGLAWTSTLPPCRR